MVLIYDTVVTCNQIFKYLELRFRKLCLKMYMCHADMGSSIRNKEMLTIINKLCNNNKLISN